jgi:hypothetical protein
LYVHVDVASHVIEHGAPPFDVTSQIEPLVQVTLNVPWVSTLPSGTVHTDASQVTSTLNAVAKNEHVDAEHRNAFVPPDPRSSIAQVELAHVVVLPVRSCTVRSQKAPVLHVVTALTAPPTSARQLAPSHVSVGPVLPPKDSTAHSAPAVHVVVQSGEQSSMHSPHPAPQVAPA